MTVTVRFAPSPTGRLHVGNARIALINWLFAKKQGGSFILRIDDTDRERSLPEYEEGILTDLNWLGLKWDRKENQSLREERYHLATDQLKESGRLYPCYETPEELAYKRKRQLARRLPPVYDRAALTLSSEQRSALETEGRQPHWRFRLEPGEVLWNDLVRGPCHYRAEHLSDPVLIRADGSYLYTLPSVVDDVEMGLTHIIRGEDHVTNTAAQIQIFQALGAPAPEFAHLPLLTDASGAGLSKRLGSASLMDLHAQGIEPLALESLLAKLGTSDPVRPHWSLDELVDNFDIGKISRATPKFSAVELNHLNARLLHEMPFDNAVSHLSSLGLTEADEAFWLGIRANLTHMAEASEWWHICREVVEPVVEEAAFVHQAADLLPAEPWTEETWASWTAAVKAASGRKGKELFHPLRLALTGRENGPELKILLPLIGRSRAQARLSGNAA